jgi:glucose-1-phosphate thymidylyltransferase
MVLGDNIFFGHGLPELLAKAASRQQGATVFAYHMRDPERYGVVTFDSNDRPVRIDEKPKNPGSNWAVTACIFSQRGRAPCLPSQAVRAGGA